MAFRHAISLLAIVVLAGLSPSKLAAQEAEVLPTPPAPAPLVPPPPVIPEQAAPTPPVLVPPQFAPGEKEPMVLRRPMVIQRSDVHQKVMVYQKISHLPAYRVTYHDHHRLRRPCCPMTTMTIAIPDPLRPGCVAEICVKAPGCVKGHPQVAESPGFLGRGVVTLCWANGHRVKVVFKKLAPHVLVHTYPA